MKKILLAFICTKFSFADATTCIVWPFHQCRRKIFFLKYTENKCAYEKVQALVNQFDLINMNQLHGEVDIFLSNLYLRLSSTHAQFLHTLAAHKLINVQKNYVKYLGMCCLLEKQYSISKGRLLPIMHTVQIQEKTLFLNLPETKFH